MQYMKEILASVIAELMVCDWQVMKRRQWKHVYDQMGGCSNNTSAATGTRRNYEKYVISSLCTVFSK